MSSRKPSVRVVEVRPDDAPSNIAPSTPPLSKAVRFAPESNDRFSRPLSYTEAWSLYYFEQHARQCSDCYKPLEVYRRGDRLCDPGHGLAQDVACHVYYRDGDIYSFKQDDSKLVRVEIPHGYSQVRSLLRAMEHGLRRSRHRTVPTYSYDRSYPVPARHTYTSNDRNKVTIESVPRPKYVRYTTVQIDQDESEQPRKVIPVTTTTASSTSRKGSLYDKDMQRKQKDYKLEIREPSDSRKDRRRSHRDSGVYF